jgi:rod shape-determining protein MreD
MPETIKIIVFILIVLFLQIGIFPHLKIFETYPNIILCSLISISIIKGLRKSIAWMVFSGLFLDFYSLSSVIGIFVVCLALCSSFSSFLSQNVFKKSNPLSIIPIFILAIIFYDLSVFGLQTIFSFEVRLKILTLLTDIIYNTIFAIPVFYLIKKNYADNSKKI